MRVSGGHDYRAAGDGGIILTDQSEWTKKGGTISNVTAEKEYGVDYDFIVRGIRAGKLQYREGEVWGNPFLRLLRSQVEQYIAEERGADYVADRKKATELRAVKKEMTQLKNRLKVLELRKAELEKKS
ncbi:MAG: hypothetical protein WC015_00900 [Methanoregula sp.]